MENILSVEKVAIIANGKIENYSIIQNAAKHYDQFVAVNGGLKHCAQLDINPFLLVGDLDSIESSLIKKFPKMKTLTFPKDKDQTDLELSIQFLFDKKVKSITVFGGMGLRTDHTLVNLFLISRYPGKLFLETEQEILFTIDKELQLSSDPGQTFSLLPLNGPALGVTTDGLKWNLDHATMTQDFISVSNVATGNEIFIQVKEGNLLCIMQKNLLTPSF